MSVTHSADRARAAAQATVRRLTGLVFPENRRDVLTRGLAVGMRRAGIAELPLYLARIEQDASLLDDLVAEITVGETYFFRDPEQFDMIRSRILLPLVGRAPRFRPPRIWCAGCASGEEPYTLAILLAEMGVAADTGIVGTDIARPALARARDGRYGRWSMRATPPDIAARYFAPSGDGVTLAPEIREAVEFRYLNLAADVYPSLASGIWGMDLVLCRNVLIYFDAETVARVARRLLDTLAPDGWLVTGAADPPLGSVVPCEVAVTETGLAYRRAGRPATRFAAVTVQAAPPLRDAVALDSQADLAAEAARPPPREFEGGAAAPHRVLDEPQPVLDDAIAAYSVRDYGAAAAAASRFTRDADAGSMPWVILVRSLANAGDLPGAGRACAAAIDRHPTSPELAYLHGVLLAEGGRHADAVRALRGAVYLDRHLAVAHLALAGALRRVGDLPSARRALRNAERSLARTPPDEVVPASDGERAGRLVEATRVHLALLGTEAA